MAKNCHWRFSLAKSQNRFSQRKFIAGSPAKQAFTLFHQKLPHDHPDQPKCHLHHPSSAREF
jgi:hypothetical protein